MVMAPTVFNALVYVGAWAIMMAAVMLPSASPMIALYAATQRNSAGPIGKVVSVALFALTYLALWAVTGAPIYSGAWRSAPSSPTGWRTVSPGCFSSLGCSRSHRSSRCVCDTAGAPSVPSRSLALGVTGWRPGDGLGARALLSRLLLGTHGRAGSCRRDGTPLGLTDRGSRGGREALEPWRMDRAADRSCSRAAGYSRRCPPGPRRCPPGRRPLDVTAAKQSTEDRQGNP